MSSNSNPAPDKPETPSETKSGPSPELRRPRKINPNRQEEDEAGMSGDQLRALSEQLQALFSLAGSKPPSTGSTETDGPAVKAKNRRFSAKTSSSAPDPSATPSPAEGDIEGSGTPAPVSGKTKVPTVSGKPVEEAFAETRRIKLLRDAQRRRRNIALGALALSALAFAGGRWSVPATVADSASKEPSTAVTGPRTAGLAPWTDPAIQRLGKILALDQAGKIEDAYHDANELRATSGALPGLELYLGNLTTRRLRYNDAHSQLGTLTGVDVPPLINALGSDQVGFTYSRERAFVRAIKFFEDAVANDPFQAKYYLHWGEALRRRGRQGEAVDIFEQGLLRVPLTAESGGLRGVLNLKMHLAKLESGRGGQTKDQIATGIQDIGQAGYWQLTAAAQALQESQFPEGVEALQKARAILSADEYDTLAADYFFRAFTGQNEVAAALPSMDIPHQKARARRGDYFVDP